MDLEFIERVIRLVEEAEIGELELESKEGLKIVVRKTVTGTQLMPSTMMMPQMYPYPGMPPQPATVPQETKVASPEEMDLSIEIIKSPMVGTFYRSPSPDSPPFVDVGSAVQNNTVVCILEAMKVMNEIKAGISGTVMEILVENGQPVEFGQALFKIKKS
ncbi:MAG: acetyl-CoA carboxylase biotin carboxyl carrier protein [bacterium]|jgi:acetyl-CoA carboxylase biotin carboxyl carrier protein